jgi:hypothetical protein
MLPGQRRQEDRVLARGPTISTARRIVTSGIVTSQFLPQLLNQSNPKIWAHNEQ